MEGLIVPIVLLGIPLYFVPTIVAFKRDHPQRVSIVTLNILLGWSFLGWVGALVWSLTSDSSAAGAPPSAAPSTQASSGGDLPMSSRTAVAAQPGSDVVQQPADVVDEAAHIISKAIEESRTRTIRWRDAGQFLDQDIRQRASKAGVLNLAGESLTAAIEQGLLMLLDQKAPDARVARTSRPLPEPDSPAPEPESDESAEDQDSDGPGEADSEDDSTASSVAPDRQAGELDQQALDDLEVLIRMHERGRLTDEELEAAKRRLLDDEANTANAPPAS